MSREYSSIPETLLQSAREKTAEYTTAIAVFALKPNIGLILPTSHISRQRFFIQAKRIIRLPYTDLVRCDNSCIKKPPLQRRFFCDF